MLVRTVVLAAFALTLASCAGRMPDRIDPAFEAPYTLDAGDRLRVVVFGQDGLTNSYAVDSAGKITMPLIGAVEARGNTFVFASPRIQLVGLRSSGQGKRCTRRSICDPGRRHAFKHREFPARRAQTGT